MPANGIIPLTGTAFGTIGLYYAPPDLHEARLHSWNLAVQRELWFGFTGEAAYVGNVGRGIQSSINLNAANVLGTAIAGNDNSARFLFPSYGRTADVEMRIGLNTSYNSLQMKLDRRFKNNWLMTMSYPTARRSTIPTTTAP